MTDHVICVQDLFQLFLILLGFKGHYSLNDRNTTVSAVLSSLSLPQFETAGTEWSVAIVVYRMISLLSEIGRRCSIMAQWFHQILCS